MIMLIAQPIHCRISLKEYDSTMTCVHVYVCHHYLIILLHWNDYHIVYHRGPSLLACGVKGVRYLSAKWSI